MVLQHANPKHISNHITHISNEEDLPFLKSKLFNVNKRLFNSSVDYRQLILRCCSLIRNNCLTNYDGYKKPHGMSGANVAIPFNIIGVVRNRNTESEWVEIMINPTIEEYMGELIEVETNCGSIRYNKPLKIQRYTNIRVHYMDENGSEFWTVRDRSTGSLTIQHEIDHNNGILISDRLEMGVESEENVKSLV